MRRCLARCDFKQKKGRRKYIWPTHHSPLHLPSQKKKIIIKISGFENTFLSISSALLWKWKFLRFFPLSCNGNNYMTYNWPNSAFFNFQEYPKQENCRQYSAYSAFFFFFWETGTKNLTKRKFIVEPRFFTSWTITSEKCTRAHVQENKSVHLSIYLSIWKPFWKRVYKNNVAKLFKKRKRFISTLR